MAVPKWHRSKSRQGQRRMHVFLKSPQWVTCLKCKKPAMPHIVCAQCGFYNGKEALDVLSKLTKKEKKQKEREIAAKDQHGK